MKTLSLAVSFAVVSVLVSCASDVPPPDDENAEAWTPGIQSSYPDWQPPEAMPDGNPAYAEAFGEPRPVESVEPVAVVAVEEETVVSEPVKKVDETPVAAKPQETKPQVQETKPQVKDVKPQPVETKPAAPAKFMRVDVFPAEDGVDGIYAVNGERVNTAALKNILNETGKTNKEIVVILFGRPNSASADLDSAVDYCKAAGLDKINVMTNEDVMEQRKAEVRAAKGIKDEPAKTAAADQAKTTAKVREKLVVDPDQPSTEYVVKDGDSLSSIAKALYHDGNEWEIIFEANKERLNGKPNYLKLGTKLVIPAVKKVPASQK